MAQRRHSWWIPYVVASMSLAVSGVAAVSFSRLLDRRNEGRFNESAEVVRERIESRAEKYLGVARGARALFVADAGAGAEELARYVAALRLAERYPGVVGIGVRRDGNAIVWQQVDRSVDAVNTLALLGDDAQRAAMATARDTGQATASERVPLSQRPGSPAGIMVYLPLYQNDAQMQSIEERRAAFRGFTIIAYRVDHVLADVFVNGRPRNIALEVYDSSEPSRANFLYSVGTDAKVAQRTPWHTTRVVTIAGRPWTVLFRAEPAFEQIPGHGAAEYILIAGVLLAAVLFLVMRGLVDARAEAESQRNNLHELFMRMPAAIAILRGPEHRYELSNPVNRALAGGRDLVGVKLRDGLPALVAQGFLELADHVYHTGESVARSEVPFVIDTDSGKKHVYVSGVYQPIRGSDGRVDGVMVFAYEVTEQVLARQKVETAHATVEEALVVLDAIFESVPIGMAFVDSDLCYVRMNRVLGEINGVDAERAIGRNVREVLPALAESVEPYYRRVFETGQPILHTEIVGTSPRFPSEVRYWEASYYPVRDPAGRVFLVGVLVADVTDRKRAQEERELLLGELRSAVKMRDDFLAIAGHELKTPTAALLLQIQGLTRQALRESSHGVPLRFVERLSKASNQIVRLEALIRNLLDVSRISEGRMQLQLEPLELTMLVNDVVERLGEQLERAGCGVIVDAPEAVHGEWDRVRLDQVLINLVTNAMKYGAGQRIEIRVRRMGDRARLDVRDHGIGISGEDAARIFGRFERAVSEHNYGGFGLGLWISREIVQRLGGTIDFESNPGKGTTFTVDLPLKQMEAAS